MLARAKVQATRVVALAARLAAEISKLRITSFFFEFWDKDSDGFIDQDEFSDALVSLGISTTRPKDLKP